MNEASREAYLNLIESLLTCPKEERTDILQANLELIDDGFARYLRQDWATQTLATLDAAEQAYKVANILYGLNISFKNLRQGSRASNLEVAIACLEIGLTVVTREADSEKWAKFQNSLGIAYTDRIRGEKAENLEMAIEAYQAALSVRTRKDFPVGWAATQNNLGTAYSDRIRGEKAENLEWAIEAYLAALEVYTRKDFPVDWATTQNNLGTAYSDRIRGEKAENLESAIEACLAALSIRTRKDFPVDWATTQINLGIAYYNRIRGEKVENQESAIAAFLAALSVCTREAFPAYWATTQNNLGNAYLYRIRGEKAENLESAIEAYQAALSVRTRKDFPVGWAATQNNLGTAYSDRIRGEKAENLESAIEAYQAALSVRTREDFPVEWAATQNNLGTAYYIRIRGEKAENLESAIEAYQAALSVCTRKDFLINNAETLDNLGLAYRDNSQLLEACNTFAAAIETVELMRSEIIIGGEADRQKLAEEWNKLYQRMVEVCLEMENSTATLEYVERSKTRNLVELFHKARSLPDRVQRITFAEIRSLLAENEAILEWYITYKNFKVFIITHDSTTPDVWESSYQDLQALEEFQQEYIDDYTDEETDNWGNRLEARLEKLAEILHIDEIIASYIPETCQKLILVPFRYLHLFPLHALASKRQQANSQSEETGCLLELFPGGVRYTPSCQLLQLSGRINATGEESSPTKLFAIQNPTEDLDFTDIEVEAIAKSFNPAEILSRQQANKTALQQQIALLQNADIAHFSCHGFFDFINPEKSALILAGAKVTGSEDSRGGAPVPAPAEVPVPAPAEVPVPAPTEVPSEEKHYIRSRRGEKYDIAECLTLTEIFDLQLSKCSLVVLSACETGLTDIKNTTDEYIGLPSGFFYAGVTNVLSTLWAVHDVSTAILTIKFYELLLSDSRLSVAVALRESQLWLRDLTVADLLKWTAASKLLSS
jgi:CHAT domain-containing protein